MRQAKWRGTMYMSLIWACVNKLIHHKKWFMALFLSTTLPFGLLIVVCIGTQPYKYLLSQEPSVLTPFPAFLPCLGGTGGGDCSVSQETVTSCFMRVVTPLRPQEAVAVRKLQIYGLESGTHLGCLYRVFLPLRSETRIYRRMFIPLSDLTNNVLRQ